MGLRRTLMFLLVIGPAACGSPPMNEAGMRCEDHPLYSRLLGAANQTLQVSVTLADDRDDDLERLQTRLDALLEGAQHHVLRRSDNFPIVTLRVGEEAFCRLAASALVQVMQEDVPEPPGA